MTVGGRVGGHHHRKAGRRWSEATRYPVVVQTQRWVPRVAFDVGTVKICQRRQRYWFFLVRLPPAVEG